MKHGDFTALASSYAAWRPGYSPFVLESIMAIANKYFNTSHDKPLKCVDVGAGTGIWTRLLAASGADVIAVEPNDAMRGEGMKQNGVLKIDWRKGSAEDTGLPKNSFDMVSMASSFHWTDFEEAIREFYSILKAGGLFVALWNPRNYENNPLLLEIENHIYQLAPNMKRVSTGRSDFCNTLASKLRARDEFDDVLYLEGIHTEHQTPERYIGIWESVNDIRVQLGEEKFAEFIDWLKKRLAGIEVIDAEYTTRAWVARRKKD